MKSPIILKDKTCQPGRLTCGFTLIEIMVVIGLVSVVLGFGFFFDLDNLRFNSFRGDRDTLVSTLQHTRAEAMANICRGLCTDGKPHGVKIFPDKFVIFQGEDYSSRDTDFDIFLEASSSVVHDGTDEVVFTQLSGKADPGEIIFTSEAHTSTITINSEGQIIWTN